MENFGEPSLNPPEDERLDAIVDHISDLSIEDLAFEIQSRSLDQKIKERILKLEFPIYDPNSILEEIVDKINLDVLLHMISKKTMDDIVDYMIDHIYFRDS